MRRKYFLLIAIILIAAAFLTACTTTETENKQTVKSVTVSTVHEGAYVIGEEFSLSDITLKILYSNGDEKKVTANEYMLDEENRAKFYEQGVHTVIFNYEGAEAFLQITVEERKQEVTFLATFFSNGGSSVANQNVKVIKAFPNPTRKDYTFDGWYASPDFSGNRAVAPYTLNADTAFYAKWVDNRRCNVKFYDGDKVLYDFDVVYGTGINIRDLESYPAPEEKEGLVFTGWALASGSNLDEIVTDTVITAGYDRIKCRLEIEFVNEDGKVVKNPYTYNYGEIFNLSQYRMPTKEGHTTRWVLYRGDSEEFEEIEDENIVITDEKITIVPYHEINKYNVIIYNGVPESEQTHADLKSGDVALKQVYADEATKRGFRVEYNTDFYLSEYNQEPYLVAPTPIYGYNAEWCFVVTDKDGNEVLYNKEHKIWNENTKSFEGEFTTNFDLYLDNDSESENKFSYVSVRNGNLVGIKGDVVIRAKYWKKVYTVTISRRQENGWEQISDETGSYIQFKKEYLSDFCLYNTEEYDGRFTPTATASDVEFFYHKNNVPRWTYDSDVSDLWKQIYFNGNSSDDFAVKWYTKSDRNEQDRVDFIDGEGNLGYYEITDDLSLFCEDIDLRKYTVTIRYGYDFATGQYKYSQTYDEVSEKTPLTLPDGYGASVTRSYGVGNVQYVFDGWYDYPYVPETYGYPYGTSTKGFPYLDDGDDLYCYPYGPNGVYAGEKGDDFLSGRTRNVIYYAHYRCDTQYTFKVYDKTQQTAYKDISGYDGCYYDVQEDSITYTVPAGTTINLSMLYKGRVLSNGTVSGQVYYERATYIAYFDGEFTSFYNSIIDEYGRGAPVTAKAALKSLIDSRQAKADAYVGLLGRIYNYDFGGSTPIDKDYFLATYMNVKEYNDLRAEIHELQGKFEVLDSYEKRKAKRDEYAAADEAEASSGGLYKKYSDSVYDLNLAYGHDMRADETDYKYRFAGWFSNDTYSELYSAEYDFEWVAWNGDITLYAKWADEEKGTEGLVFRKVLDENGNEALAVADLMNRQDYEQSDIYGCGFNDFTDGNEYSINLNDQGAMPVYLGDRIEVQIPATHGGTNSNPLPVIGVLSEAFAGHGQQIRSISMTGGIKFLEEDAFVRCNLATVFYNGEGDSELLVDGEKAVYQKKTYSYTVGGELRTAKGNVLIAYANSSSGESYTVLDGTTRIAADAFYLASKLKKVTLPVGLESIGKRAFSSTGLTGAFSLPDSLVWVEEFAFSGCDFVSDIVVGESSALHYVGKEAFNGTGWYKKQVGVITLNSLLMGVRNADGDTFDRDENGDYVYTSVNGVLCYSHTSEGGVLYFNPAGEVVKVVLSAAIKRITEWSFSTIGGNMSEVEILGKMPYGIGRMAFGNCSGLKKVYFAEADSTCMPSLDAFAFCSSVTVYVNDKTAIHENWFSCENVTVEEI